MPTQLQETLDAFKTFWNQLLQFTPQLLFGILLLAAGWFAARLLRTLIVRFLRLIRLDVAAEKAGIEGILMKGGVQYSSVNILANLVYWVLVLVLTLSVLDSLGLSSAQELFNRFLQFIPNVIVALLVFAFGFFLAKLARGAAFTYLSNVGIRSVELISAIISWAILFLVTAVALQQLSLGGQLLITIFEIAFAAVCLALAIAFGLAGKEWAGQVLEKLWRNSR